MTLIESPSFQKRIKETLLRSLLVAPMAHREPNGQNNPSQSQVSKELGSDAIRSRPQNSDSILETDKHSQSGGVGAEMDSTNTAHPFEKEDRGKNPKAVIQSLNFNALSPKPTIEDDNYRENLGSYHYWETGKATADCLGIPENQGPEVYWVPYVVEESAQTQRTGRVDTSYPTLRGSATEILKYTAKAGEKFDPSEEIKAEGSKKTRRVYPFSVVNVPLPWTPMGEKGEIKNLPNPEELVEGCRLLTDTHKKELVVLISGPKAATSQFQRKFSTSLNSLRMGRLIYPAYEINVEQGYLCSEKEVTSRLDLEFFKTAASFSQNSQEWEKQFSLIAKDLDQYIAMVVEQRRSKSKMDEALEATTFADRVAKKKPSKVTIQEGISSEARWKKSIAFCSEFDRQWQAFRRSTLGLPGRGEVLDIEDSSDKALSSLSRQCVKENRSPSQEEIGKISSGYKDVLQKYRDLQKKVASRNGDSLKSEPWVLYVTVIKNSMGILNRTIPKNTVIEKKCWTKSDDQELLKLVSKTKRTETHLAQTLYSGYNYNTNSNDIECLYPKEEPETIQDPAKFRMPPKDWQTLTTPLALESPLEARSVRIDIRLAPRPDLLTETFLENDNLQVQCYNTVSGRPTGLKDATLWRPIITRRGISHIEKTLSPLGYKIECSPEVQNFVERKVKQAEKRLAPNYPLTPYESLAYFENGHRLAESTVVHPDSGEPLWIEGKSYHITPSWKRQTMMVDHSIEEETQSGENRGDSNAQTQAKEQAEAQDVLVLGQSNTADRIQNSSRIQTLTERQINFGFATFIVEAENNKTYEIRETVSKETMAMEKERIAIEIDHILGRLEELNSKTKPTKAEASEIKKLEARLEEKQLELDTWAPMLEDFLTAFPPEAPPLASEVYGDRIEAAAKSIYARFAPYIKHNPEDKETSLKDYQLKWASVGAVKRGHLNGSVAGSGKTLVSIMASWRMGHHYNWVICPTIAMKTWAKELHRVGLYHEIIGCSEDPQNPGTFKERGVVSHMRDLRERFHKRERQKNRLGLIEPEYYIVSAEQVALGGEGNKVFSPWHYDYKVDGAKQKSLEKALEEEETIIPSHWTVGTTDKGALLVRVWSDRIDNGREIREAGFERWLRPVKFYRAVKKCPQCDASAPTWSRHGHCGRCGHTHSSITRVKSQWDAAKHPTKLDFPWQHMTIKPRKGSRWEGSKTSNRQYPLYKIMGKHVGCKIIDEIHNYSNFHSQHGAALLQVKSKDSIVLSGTLCKTHISELEPSLCQVYEANSGEFPYSPWGMDLFKEQFQTIEIESTFRSRTQRETLTREESREVRRRTTEKVVPEASNLTKLRALLHGVMCSVGENEMESVWGLKPIRESIRYVELQPQNAAIYQEWERLLKESYSGCKTESQKVGMIRKARSQITHLAYACDGPEKLEATIQWIQEGMERGERSVIVGPSTRFYTMLCKVMKERKLPFMAMGNLAPDKRFDFLNKFRDSDCPNLVSRIRLINVNFNQLTCCTRILFTGIDPSPAALRQMQKRLNRIGQTQDVHCTFLITQLPPTPRQLPSQRRRGVTRAGTNNDNILDVEETLADIETLQAGTSDFHLSSDQNDPNDQSDQNQETNPLGSDLSEGNDTRPPSYEERLFALVLRRENAIKQTLQQADRQRDPQELYEMLKDRQTLNQLLQDIVDNARSDKGVSDIIQAMIETPSKALGDKIQGDESSRKTQNDTSENPSENIGLIQPRNPVTYCPTSLQDVILPRLPSGTRFSWNEIKTKSGRSALQGQLFSI